MPHPGYGPTGKVKRKRKLKGGRRRKLRIVPSLGKGGTAGGTAMIVPIKCGYQYTLTGTGAAFVALDPPTGEGLQNLPPAWFTRYSSLFEHIKINKIRIEVSCGYNIGQHNVGTQSLYRIWSKKAASTGETPPGDATEWLNMQNATRKTFRGAANTVNYYYTPAFEETAQPLNTAVTQLKLLRKQWMSMPAAGSQAAPHIGLLAHIVRMDRSAISNTNVFNVNVTMYCQMRGLKQL